MKLKLAIDPDIIALIAAGKKAVTTAMREAGTGLKSTWRSQITGAGLGARLANSIRLASFPKSGESLNAAALVWSNAPVIVGVHDTGPLIRSKNGFWLAIPTVAAGESTRGEDHPRRMGTPHRFAIAVHLSAEGPKPSGGRRAAEHEGASRRVPLENRQGRRHRADLPSGAAGQVAETAGSCSGC